MKMLLIFLLLTSFFPIFICLLPPKFQWKVIDFAWEGHAREAALASGDYIPQNNMPGGIARWRNKLFVTIPRWKKGIPSSLNYIYLNGSQSQRLVPYPSWKDAFVSNKACCVKHNNTVVSTFRVHVDSCDRLWVADNGVADMLQEIRQVAPPALLVFDLHTDQLLHKYVFSDEVLRDSTVLNSITVDVVGKSCRDSYAYIPDMGSNALIVYSLIQNDAWRVENYFFHFDPHSSTYKVGGIDFFWSDGISSAVTAPAKKSSGYPDLYFHPTSSTKQFRMSTRLLRDRDVPPEDIFSDVEVVGDRGARSQATACAYDSTNHVLFYTQLSKNGVSCWNLEKPLTRDNVPLILSDCALLEFPNDIQVDHDGNVWILSNRQSRFLYGSMDSREINFRVLTAPASSLLQGTVCERLSSMSRAISFIKRSKNKSNQIIT